MFEWYFTPCMTIININNEYLMGNIGKIPSYLCHLLVIRSEEA